MLGAGAQMTVLAQIPEKLPCISMMMEGFWDKLSIEELFWREFEYRMRIRTDQEDEYLKEIEENLYK